MIYSRDVAVIVLNYENHKDTVSCLKSLYELSEHPGAIIVVDNNSHDNSVHEIISSWKEWDTPCVVDEFSKKMIDCNISKAFLVLHDRNNGYAEGNNIGIKFAQKLNMYKAYWVINNDTNPEKQSLKEICDKYNKNDIDAVIGSTLIYTLNPSKIQCAGGCRLNKWIGTTSGVGGELDLQDVLLMEEDAVEAQIDFIHGAAMFIPDNVIRTVGMMREDFFLYVEETEYAVRLRKAGIPLLWAKKSLVFHKEGGTSGASSSNVKARPAWVDYLMLRNRAKMIIDHFPLSFPLLFMSYFIVAMKRVARGQTNRVPLVMQALYHAMTGKMGKPFCHK